MALRLCFATEAARQHPSEADTPHPALIISAPHTSESIRPRGWRGPSSVNLDQARQRPSHCVNQRRRTRIVGLAGDVVHCVTEGDAVLRVGEAE
jgi:hypothetical protein